MMSTNDRSRPNRGHETHRRNRTEYRLANSTVRLEPGPAGVIARVQRGERVEYAGPLPNETIHALAEVSE